MTQKHKEKWKYNEIKYTSDQMNKMKRNARDRDNEITFHLGLFLRAITS